MERGEGGKEGKGGQGSIKGVKGVKWCQVGSRSVKRSRGINHSKGFIDTIIPGHMCTQV